MRRPAGTPRMVFMTSRTWTLVVVCAATAMLMLDMSVVNTALPAMAKDLGTDLAGIQWVVDAYTLALAAFVLTAGSLADRLGRRRLLNVGLVIFMVASIGCALSTDLVTLDIARAVQGLGGAILFAVSLAILAHAYPDPHERAKALGAYGATIGASFAIGPLIGGALATWINWQAIFLANVPFGLAALAITARHVVESKDPNAPRIDWPGQATLIASLFLLVLALLRGNVDGWTSPVILAEFAGALFCGVVFVLIQIQSANPMMPLRVFRARGFAAAQAGAFAISASYFSVFLYLTLYSQHVLGLSPIQAGMVYIPGTLVMFGVSGAAGRLKARFTPREILAWGLVLCAAGMALCLLATAQSDWTVLLPGTIVAAFGIAIFNPALADLALSSLPDHESGLAAGTNDTFRDTGIAVGIAGLGALFPADALAGAGDAAAFMDGLHAALIAGVAIALAGVAAVWFLLPERRPARRRDPPRPAAPRAWSARPSNLAGWPRRSSGDSAGSGGRWRWGSRSNGCPQASRRPRSSPSTRSARPRRSSRVTGRSRSGAWSSTRSRSRSTTCWRWAR